MSETGEIERQAGRGLRWSLVGNLVMKAGSFAMSLVLARLLVPEDFGVFAIALAVSQFVIHINDAGVIASTVQWRGKLAEVAPTATVVAVASSCTLYAVFWVIAPFYASMAGSEDATWVIRILMATNVIYGLTAVRSAALMRGFEQDKLAWANLAGFAANASISISLAASGAGAYSFAWGQLGGAALTGVLVVALARVRFTVGFDRALAARLLRFGLPLCVGFGVEGLLLNVDIVLVGDVLGPERLGLYLLAFNIAGWVPGIIGTAIRYVALPSFARLAEEGPAAIEAGVRRAVPLLGSIVLPIAVLMGTLAPALVGFLYEPHWLPAAQVLRFLAVVMAVRMLNILITDILAALGHTRATMWVNLCWAVALVPALLVGARHGGIQGAALAHAVIALVLALPMLSLALRRAGVPPRLFAAGLARPVLGAAVAGVTMAGLATVTDQPFGQLCVAGGGGLLVFALIAVPRAVLMRLLRQGRAHARL
ncbi:oligosaccharide flippase family protein [Nonomuraea glycinis]|uniref:Lipopolysaccharide biosynthesis protein n=1 Tax=Nonomuraea glycinis TaxID=2047744 RepID=A0A918AAX4_9ACTN|nr:oligosaccharide flippase family protein [Nonomuraea glycinis]MCA2178248.1 oligosaccharide flippase family protein [Nonomuraea glycinis]GGP12651.1 lipopolysaccharide biosynthesis protein [Nonomuraea glycinis]